MLTQSTASQLNISDRLDPYQSMIGGAQYFLNMTKKIPSRIQEPDKTWFALAAYNIGYGHLEDARVITQRAGKNPDLWKDVRESLPLLAIEKHYKKTKHGYDLMLWEFPEQRDDYFFNLFN